MTEEESVKKIRTLDFDKILDHVGPLGRYQWVQLTLLFILSLSSGIAVTTFAFTGFVPNHRCVIPQCESIENPMTGNEALQELVASIVDDKTGKTCKRVTVPSLDQSASCSDYQAALQSNISQSWDVNDCSKEELIFDTSVVKTSLVEYYGMTCEHLMVRSILNSLYLVGMLLGSFTVGLTCDRFGRKAGMMLSITLISGSGILAAFVNNQYVFAALRITVGMGGIGSYIVSSVIAAEATLPSLKIVTTVYIMAGFILGELTLSLEAYLVRYWFTLQLVAHLPMLALFSYYFLIPESTRWLITKDRIEEAIDDLQKRSTFNGKPPIPENLLQTIEVEVGSTGNPTILDLFRPMVICKRSINMFFQWFSVTMAYYGLLFASTSLSGDPYKNFALVVFVELLNIVAYYKLPNLIGRRATVSGAQLVCGICTIAGGLLIEYPSMATVQIILVMMGRMTAALGFTTVYLYTSEMFPTQIRGTAVGCCSTIARLGGIIALLMQGGLDEIWPPLTMVIFGSVAITAGFLATQFPETRNDKLPETMEDALQLGKNIQRNKFGCILPLNMEELQHQ